MKFLKNTFIPLYILLFFITALQSCKKEVLDLDSALSSTAIFNNGDYGVVNYRIPATIVTPAGTLLMACDARVKRYGDMPNKINCVLKRSTDHGVSWSDPITVFDFPGAKAATDPSFIVDDYDSTVYLFVNFGEEGIGLNNSYPGYGKNTVQVLVVSSRDNGLTWSEPVNITQQVKEPGWSAVMASPGHGIQLRDGTLVHPAYYRLGNGGLYSTFVFYSRDHGKTWQKSNTASTNASENSLVELKNGSILMNIRSADGKGLRQSTKTSDLGNTWEPVVEEVRLPDPGCNASILRLQNHINSNIGAPVVFINAADHHVRRNLEIKLSNDDCKTWGKMKVLYAGYGAYSDAAFLHDGTLGVFYERGIAGDPTRSIYFAKIPLSWLEK